MESIVPSGTDKQDGEPAHPAYGTEDYRRHAVLFNDITYAPIERRLTFSQRLELQRHLWAQGWRRDVRDEDVTERPGGAS